MKILDQLRDRFLTVEQERAQSAASEYRQVVERLADDDEPELSEVESALHTSGRTIEQLTADVELFQQRRQWAAQLADASAAEGDLADIDKRQQAEDERWNKLYEERRQRLGKLVHERQGAEHRLTVARTAGDQLRRTCNEGLHPLLVQRHGELTKQLAPIRDRLNQLRETELGRDHGLIDEEKALRERLRQQVEEINAALAVVDDGKLIP